MKRNRWQPWYWNCSVVEDEGARVLVQRQWTIPPMTCSTVPVPYLYFVRRTTCTF